MSEVKRKLTAILGGKYEVVGLLHEGGMGEIYVGIHRALKRRVAIKVIKHGQVSDPDMEKRFFREARLVAKLDHSGIIEIYDFGTEDGLSYLIMPFVEGETLKEKLKSQGQLGLKEALIMAMAITNALGYAHQKGIIHRDIKPSNIIIDKHQKVLLSDFGISKSLTDHDITLLGSIIGTPRYMSPEQIQTGECDSRSDLYSLGLVLYEMFTGVYPFKEKDIAGLLYAQVHTIPPRPNSLSRALPAKLSAIIMKLLKKSPADRFNSCQELYAELRKIPFPRTPQTQFDKDEKNNRYPDKSGLFFAETLAGSMKRTPPDLHSKEHLRRHVPHDLKKKFTPKSILLILGISGLAFLIAIWRGWLTHETDPLQQIVLKNESDTIIDSSKTTATKNEKNEQMRLQLEQEVDNKKTEVDDLLLKAQTAFASGKIDSPPGENAMGYLSEIRKISPEYTGGNELMRAILAYFIVKAKEALQSKNIPLARSFYEKAADMTQDYKLTGTGLSELGKQVEDAEALKRLESLLSQASSSYHSGRIDSPKANNSLYFLAEIKKISPDNQVAENILGEILTDFVSRGKAALQNGDFEAAQIHYGKANKLANEYSLQDRRLSEFGRQIEQAKLKKSQKTQLEHLVSMAQSSFKEGRIDNPPGNNTLAYLEEIRKISLDNIEAYKLTGEVYASFIKKGEVALLGNNLSLARSYFRKAEALGVKFDFPDNGLQHLDEEINIAEKNNKQKELIEDLLSKAHSLFVNGKIDSPADENALFFLANVENIDPGNVKARNILNMIIENYVDMGQIALIDGRLEEAENIEKKAVEITKKFKIINDSLLKFSQNIKDTKMNSSAKKKAKVWGIF